MTPDGWEYNSCVLRSAGYVPGLGLNALETTEIFNFTSRAISDKLTMTLLRKVFSDFFQQYIAHPALTEIVYNLLLNTSVRGKTVQTLFKLFPDR